jgi:hypothetical protein
VLNGPGSAVNPNIPVMKKKDLTGKIQLLTSIE